MKGICKKCAVDLGDGLACHGKCEQKVKTINWMNQAGLGMYKWMKEIAIYIAILITALAIYDLNNCFLHGFTRWTVIPLIVSIFAAFIFYRLGFIIKTSQKHPLKF
jgi:hypothetical protein